MNKTYYSGEIIDAHMHLWDLSNGGYSWLDQPRFKSIKKNFLIEDYLRVIKNQRISKAVYVEATDGSPQDPVLETKRIQEIADHYGMPQGIVGYAALHHPGIENQLKRHCEYPNFRGIRMSLCHSHKKGLDYMNDKAWQHGFSLLSKYNLSFDMHIFPEQLPDAAKLLKVYNDIPVILTHLALSSNVSDENFEFWMSNLKNLAKNPMVFIKISAIGLTFGGVEHLDNMYKYIDHAIQVFGADRCMFASNCPVDNAFIPFNSIFEIFKKVASNYSEAEQHMLFYQNAQRLYRL